MLLLLKSIEVHILMLFTYSFKIMRQYIILNIAKRFIIITFPHIYILRYTFRYMFKIFDINIDMYLITFQLKCLH